MEDSNFMHRFGYDLDAFRSVWAEGLLNFAQVINKSGAYPGFQRGGCL